MFILYHNSRLKSTMKEKLDPGLQDCVTIINIAI